jgi:predicted MFS family arabinose efflux permease
LLVALQLGVIALVPYWPARFAAFIVLGVGFYMLHDVLQLYATELSDEARGSAISLHSASFFLGQAVGPVAYGFGISHAGAPASLLTAAVMAALGIFCALTLRDRARA